jgi:ribosome-associated protein
MAPNELAIPVALAKAAANKKASDIKILDLRGKSDLCDYQVICSGESDRQTQAIAQEVDRVAKRSLGIKPSNVEGMQSGQWILIDLGSTMVHIFQSEMRGYYALEGLWPEAEKVPFK